jgi:hypothetical protein
MERSNPLDRSVANINTWLGTQTFESEVGFDSLDAAGTTAATTSGGTILVGDLYPGDSNDPQSANEANAVGNPGKFPGPRYYPIWHPSAINLDILPSSLSNSTAIGATDLSPAGALNRMSLADWVFDGTTTASSGQWRLLQAPSQIMQFITTGTAAAQAFYQANEFNLTAYNRAPEFNVFGKPRLLTEERIASKQTNTNHDADTCFGINSGTELMFCQTPDIDPYGPTYFHGMENETPYTGGASYYPDLNAVQMVADYISGLLARTDWPGMPSGQSFVSKWGGGQIGAMEADQVAWNIVAMGNYASDLDYADGNVAEWPDAYVQVFQRTLASSTIDSSGATTRPDWSSVSDQTPAGAKTVGEYDPNLSLRVGKLSGKAIMPYTPRPMANEVDLIVNAIPVSSTNPGVYYLTLSLNLQLYTGRRGPPGSFWPHNNSITFVATHFFYNAVGMSGSNTSVNITQGATGTPSAGNGGLPDIGQNFGGKNSAGSGGSTLFPYANCMAGGGITLASGSSVNNTVWIPTDTFLNFPTTPPTTTKSGQGIYIANGSSMISVVATSGTASGSGTNSYGQAIPTSKSVQPFKGLVSITAKARLALYAGKTQSTWELIPVWDAVDANPKTEQAVLPPQTSGTGPDSLSWNFTIDLTQAKQIGSTYTRPLQVTDPRLGGNILDQNGNPVWVQTLSGTNYEGPDGPAGSGGLPTGESATEIANGLDLDSYAYFDFQGQAASATFTGGFYANSPRPSIGFLDCVPTGMQRGIVNSTVNLGPSGNSGQLPDWLLLDIVAPTFPDTNQPVPAPYSYLHSTMGKVNINNVIYPAPLPPSGGTTQRNLPIEAVFKNAVPDSALSTIVNNIVKHTPASSGSFTGINFLPANEPYGYIGQLCEIKGIADGSNTPGGVTGSKWQREALIRDLVNLFTTQSNTFHLWGAAQSIKVVKAQGNTNYGKYEAGDTVTILGEKRFESVLERSVWPGIDGAPGNSTLSASGTYAMNSTSPLMASPENVPWQCVAVSGTTTSAAVAPATSAAWASFDGPLDPNQPRANAGYLPNPGWYWSPSTNNWLNYNNTTLQAAKNPARVIMSYKPIMFRYVTE